MSLPYFERFSPISDIYGLNDRFRLRRVAGVRLVNDRVEPYLALLEHLLVKDLKRRPRGAQTPPHVPRGGGHTAGAQLQRPRPHHLGARPGQRRHTLSQQRRQLLGGVRGEGDHRRLPPVGSIGSTVTVGYPLLLDASTAPTCGERSLPMHGNQSDRRSQLDTRRGGG
eukprot:1179718-Prorocentrum_minimum.AAC.2